jgi:two-component system response regulator HydG
MQEGKIKVLVVDNEKVIRDFFNQLLSQLGLEVMEAEDGYKALELVKKEKFDLFFVDVRLPGLNGLDTYRRIRKIDPYASVVMVTGHTVEKLLKQTQEEGSYGIIRKPFDISQIKDVVSKIDKEKWPSGILVIDDEGPVINCFARILNKRSLEYSVSSDKKEALAILKEQKIGLVFLSLMLKNENAIEVFKEIKESYPQVEIMLIAGYYQKEKEIEGEIELNGCLYESLDVESVFQHVERLKEKKK